jgi:hypothetical protein
MTETAGSTSEAADNDSELLNGRNPAGDAKLIADLMGVVPHPCLRLAGTRHPAIGTGHAHAALGKRSLNHSLEHSFGKESTRDPAEGVERADSESDHLLALRRRIAYVAGERQQHKLSRSPYGPSTATTRTHPRRWNDRSTV